MLAKVETYRSTWGFFSQDREEHGPNVITALEDVHPGVWNIHRHESLAEISMDSMIAKSNMVNHPLYM